MSPAERATQLWPVLMFAAFHRQTADRETLARLLGVPAAEITPPLALLRRYCAARDIPDLTAIVVDLPRSDETDRDTVRQAVRDVFHHDWLSAPTPSVSDLEA